jgi:hypothetical protein
LEERVFTHCQLFGPHYFIWPFRLFELFFLQELFSAIRMLCRPIGDSRIVLVAGLPPASARPARSFWRCGVFFASLHGRWRGNYHPGELGAALAQARFYGPTAMASR